MSDPSRREPHRKDWNRPLRPGGGLGAVGAAEETGLQAGWTGSGFLAPPLNWGNWRQSSTADWEPQLKVVLWIRADEPGIQSRKNPEHSGKICGYETAELQKQPEKRWPASQQAAKRNRKKETGSKICKQLGKVPPAPGETENSGFLSWSLGRINLPTVSAPGLTS